MKSGTSAIFLLTGFFAMIMSCNFQKPSPPSDAPVPEVLSVFWEHSDVSMNIGEIHEIKWNSSRPSQPNIICEGSAAIITGMTQNSVFVRAFESGTGILALRIEEQETVCIITVTEDIFGYAIDEPEEIKIPAEAIPSKIIIPYEKEYLSPGQETRITVQLDNENYVDEAYFVFTKEPEKNNIEVESMHNAAIVKAVKEGEQFILISHPKAPVSRTIIYDVLPPAPPQPPIIDVSESPMIVRKGETRQLQLTLLNGDAAEKTNFQFQVIENAYAIIVKQQGSTLNVTGIAPGAGKIRITNSAAIRDYDVMVIVD